MIDVSYNRVSFDLEAPTKVALEVMKRYHELPVGNIKKCNMGVC